MKDLYFDKQYNMKFTNEEIIKYLIEPQNEIEILKFVFLQMKPQM